MKNNFFIVKATSTPYTDRDGKPQTSNKLALADSDTSPITRLSTELTWSPSAEDLAKLGDFSKLRGQEISVAVKGINSRVNDKGSIVGLPVITCDLIEILKAK